MEAQQQQQYYYQNPVPYVPPGYMLVPTPGPGCTHPLLTWTTDIRHAGLKDDRIQNVIHLLRSSPMNMSAADLLEGILSNDSYCPEARGKFMRSKRRIHTLLNLISGDPEGRKTLNSWRLDNSGYAMGLYRDTVDGEMESVKSELSIETKDLTPELIRGFDFKDQITGVLEKKAPLLNSLLRRAAQSDRAAENNAFKSPELVST